MPEEKNIMFETQGDRELWVVSGEDWRLPIYVDPLVSDNADEKHVYVSYAGSYKGSWFLALESVIKPLAIDMTGKWIVPLSKLEKVAVKANGVTPSYYVEWSGMKLYPQRVLHKTSSKLEDDSATIDDFAAFMSAECDLFSKEQIALMLMALNSSAIKWMLDRHKPLDLGFVKLVALPFRVNWKSMLDTWIPPFVMRLQANAMQDELTRRNFDDMLHNGRLFAMDAKTIRWSVEAIPGQDFVKKGQYYEAIRYNSGRSRYFDHVIRSVMLVRNSVVEVYRHWVREKIAKVGRLAESGENGSVGILPSSCLRDREPDDCPRCRGRDVTAFVQKQKSRPIRNFIPPSDEMPEV